MEIKNKELIKELRECLIILHNIRSLSLDAKYIIADRKLLGLHQKIESLYSLLLKDSGLTIDEILKEYIKPENNSKTIEIPNDIHSN